MGSVKNVRLCQGSAIERTLISIEWQYLSPFTQMGLPTLLGFHFFFLSMDKWVSAESRDYYSRYGSSHECVQEAYKGTCIKFGA